MAEKGKKTPEVRVYLPDDLNKIVRTIAAMRDESISAIVTQALELWLIQPEQQELIDRHNLEDL
ncbi:hypothetical protein H6F43_07925 [Leptolyngbya sp. FACHB-36]|uniref:hypothetical protein n=1 Tax=Leptolyngbya sp. FACHB-36 TaxID=2692808 RepID=UPI001681BA3A|nr:hypothetical protein [Leptolyngbya sp. FACHB-36]MBD2020114.1 hypothetical protein [Leptolyngbya sp. FACHB-36]